MRHFAAASFWRAYEQLPESVKSTADNAFELLKRNAHHPSLHYKKVSRYRSVRVGKRYRALAIEKEDNVVWFLDRYTCRI